MHVWKDLHDLIWDELRLPFADSFFLRSYNKSLPDQVSIATHPHIAKAHFHDTMHTWGDYWQSPTYTFSREDAIEGLRMLKEHSLSPLVWTDHATFRGNLLHNASIAPTPVFRDMSGHTYENFSYTLDLIHTAGVRYIWDGNVTTILGQDRALSRYDWYKHNTSHLPTRLLRVWLDTLGGPIWRRVGATKFSYRRNANAQYFPYTFPDGHTFYCFRRYGKWQLADIDGLGTLIAPSAIKRLAALGGTAIVYTHLGKRRASGNDDPHHVPASTVDALRALQRSFLAGQVMLSSTSRLLDYLVIRDHAKVTQDSVDFRADGIRFQRLTPDALRGFQWGIRTRRRTITVLCEGEEIPHYSEEVGNDVIRLSCDPTPGPPAPTSSRG